jgi:hypothetical protein
VLLVEEYLYELAVRDGKAAIFCFAPTPLNVAFELFERRRAEGAFEIDEVLPALRTGF